MKLPCDNWLLNRLLALCVAVAFAETFVSPCHAAPVQGRIDAFPYTEFFEQNHDVFRIIAVTEPASVEGTPDRFGVFRFGGLNQSDVRKVRWRRETASAEIARYTLWPMELESALEELKFQVKTLDSLHALAKEQIVRNIKSGRWQEANQQVTSVLALYAGLDGRVRASLDVGLLEYALLRDAGDAADDVRDARGRSSVGDEAIQIERSWRRQMLVMLTPEVDDLPKSDVVANQDAIVTAINWADFSREAYSNYQNHWPDRSIASASTGPPLFHPDEQDSRETYKVWMQEDISLVLGVLGHAGVRGFAAKGLRTLDGEALSGKSRTILTQIEELDTQDASTMSLSKLARMITALNRLRLAAKTYCNALSHSDVGFCGL